MQTSVRFLSFLFSVVFLTVFSLAPATVAQTQTAATLTGTITDPRGASIGGAQISVEQIPSAGDPVHTLSGGDGRFAVTFTPGRYRVTISRESFAPVIQEFTMAAGETREWNVRMTLEPLSSKVVVTAQTLPLDVDSSPAPVTILSRQDIQHRVAMSLPDLLATQPGFSLGRSGPEGGVTSMFLDGGNSNFTKVLVDGVPVNEPGNAVDFSNFTLDNVEKIEVVHGAESALYGSDAVSGVVQIFTRRGSTRTPEFSAFADGGSFDTARGGADLSGLFGRFDYATAASYFETSGQGTNDGFLNRTLSGNFGWKFSDAARVHLALRDNTSDAHYPGQTLLTPPNLDAHNGLNYFSASVRAEFSNGRHWRHQLTGTEARQSELFANLLSDFFLSPDPLGFCSGPRSPHAVPSTSFCDFTYFSRNQYNRAGLGAQSSYVTANAGLTAGYEYEVENAFLSALGSTHARRNNQAGFLDARWQPLARLSVSAGARAESNPTFGTRVVPRAGIAYALRVAQGAFGDTRLRISYGQGIKESRFDQSFGTDPCFPGNPNLLPEQSRTVHAEVEQKFASDRVRFTVDYFDSRFRNIISFQSDASTGCGTYFNTDLARARGANLSVEARLTRWLTASTNYTYDSTRVLAAPNVFDPTEAPGNRLLRRPVNSGNIVLNAAFKRMNWNVSGYFTGRRTDSDFLGLGLTNNPGYARFDLAGSYNLTHGVSFYGRVANLADKKYQDVLGYPALGREFRIGVKYTTRHE